MAEILIVDDEIGIRELLSEILGDEGHEVVQAENAAQARLARKRARPDLVLLDIWMPDTDGVTLLREWVEGGLLDMPVIMMSGHASVETAAQATRMGAVGFLEKPIALQKLLNAVQRALRSGVRGLPGAVPRAGVADCAAGLDGGNRGVVAARPSDLSNEGLGLGSTGRVSTQETGQSVSAGSVGFPAAGAPFFGAGAAFSRSGATFSAGNAPLPGGHLLPQEAGALLHRSGATSPGPAESGSGAGGPLGWQIAGSGTAAGGAAPGAVAVGGSAGAVFQGGEGTAVAGLAGNPPWLSPRAGAYVDETSPTARLARLSFDQPLREARDAFERLYFEHHLAREGGSMTRVAERTGLERTHLYRKLKQLGVEIGRNPRRDGA
jgi:CheY-like chemotaxis protein